MRTVQDFNATATELAIMLYQDYVRRWLLKMSGYECQQKDGEFMMAFASPLNAIQFCLVVSPQVALCWRTVHFLCCG